MEDKNNKQIANTAIPNCCGSCENIYFYKCHETEDNLFNYCENFKRDKAFELTHDGITTEEG